MKRLVTKAVASKELKIGRMTLDKLIKEGLETYKVPNRKTPLVCVQEIEAFPYIKIKNDLVDPQDF